MDRPNSCVDGEGGGYTQLVLHQMEDVAGDISNLAVKWCDHNLLAPQPVVTFRSKAGVRPACA
jgi:hypothetical protein